MTQSIDVTEAAIPGTIRDGATGATLHINADGSINGIGATGPQGPIGPGGPAIPAPTPAGGTLAVTAAMSNSAILLNTASGSTCTLPAATGSGAFFRFVVTVKPTSNAHVIQSHTSADIMIGTITTVDTATAVVFTQWNPNETTNYIITLNGGTTGGFWPGDEFTAIDIATNKWAIRGITYQVAAMAATMFSG